MKTMSIPTRFLRPFVSAAIAALFCFSTAGVAQQPAAGASAHSDLTPLELKILLVDRGGLFPCADDPPEWLVVERGRVEVEFPLIQQDPQVFQAVANHLGMGQLKQFTHDEQLLLHCFYRKVEAAWLKPEGDKFRVVMQDDAAKAAGDAGPVTYIDRQGNIMIVEKSTAAPSVSKPVREISPQPEPPSAPPATAELTKLTEIDVRLRLIRYYGKISFCTIMRPVSIKEGYESLERGDPQAVAAIRRLLGLKHGIALTARQKQQVYERYQNLQSMRIEQLAEGHYYAVNVPAKAGSNMQTRVQGIIDAQGRVMELRRRPAAGICPK